MRQQALDVDERIFRSSRETSPTGPPRQLRNSVDLIQVLDRELQIGGSFRPVMGRAVVHSGLASRSMLSAPTINIAMSIPAKDSHEPEQLFFTRAVISFQVAESVLNPRQHVSDKGPQEVYLFIVTVRLIEHAAIADALNVAQCVVAVSTLCGGRFFGFVFSVHFGVVDARENMHTLAAE